MKHFLVQMNNLVFDPNEFASAIPSTFNLAGALYSRLQADNVNDGEVELVLSLIQRLRNGTMDSYNPPTGICGYLISILEKYIDNTMKTIDLTNDHEVEAAADVLTGHVALKGHYVDIRKS